MSEFFTMNTTYPKQTSCNKKERKNTLSKVTKTDLTD